MPYNVAMPSRWANYCGERVVILENISARLCGHRWGPLVRNLLLKDFTHCHNRRTRPLAGAVYDTVVFISTESPEEVFGNGATARLIRQTSLIVTMSGEVPV